MGVGFVYGVAVFEASEASEASEAGEAGEFVGGCQG